MTNNKVFILVVVVVLLLFSSFTRSEASYSVPEYLQKVLRMSPDQIGTVMSQPIPDHAQLEIEYGFVDERFVRFMMGVSMIREMLPIEEINYAKSKNKWWKVYDRYSCASKGLMNLPIPSVFSMPSTACITGLSLSAMGEKYPLILLIR